MPGQNTGKIQLQRGTDPPSVRAILEVIERVPHLSQSDLYDPPGVQSPLTPKPKEKKGCTKAVWPSGCTPSPSIRAHGLQLEATSGRSHGRSGPRCPKMSPS